MSNKMWERLPEESSKQFQAFCIYRDMGLGRSIKKVAQKWTEGGHTSRLESWSIKNRWVSRAAAYDEHIDELRRFRNEKTIVEMSERHAREAQQLQEKAIEKLNSLKIDDMKPQDIIKFYDTAVKIERLSRGVPESIKGVQEVKEDVITKKRLQDPHVRKQASEFIRAIADSQSSPDRVSSDSK